MYIYIVNTCSYAGDAVCIHVYDAANVFMFVGSAARGQSTLCRRWSAGSGQPVNKSGIKDLLKIIYKIMLVNKQINPIIMGVLTLTLAEVVVAFRVMLYIVHSVLVWKVAAMETKVYIKIHSYMHDYNNDLCFLKNLHNMYSVLMHGSYDGMVYVES